MADEATKKDAPQQLEEYAEAMFKALGFEGPLPNDLIDLYRTFKGVKDKIHPGRLSPEGFAMVVVLFTMTHKE